MSTHLVRRKLATVLGRNSVRDRWWMFADSSASVTRRAGSWGVVCQQWEAEFRARAVTLVAVEVINPDRVPGVSDRPEPEEVVEVVGAELLDPAPPVRG